MVDLDNNERRLLKKLNNEKDKTLNLSCNSGTVVKLSSYGLITSVSSSNYVDLFDHRIPYFFTTLGL
jgi:hypothetical protein